MSDDSDRLRARAKECRDLAPLATDAEVRDLLLRVAEELDEETDRTDADDVQQFRGPSLIS